MSYPNRREGCRRYTHTIFRKNDVWYDDNMQQMLNTNILKLCMSSVMSNTGDSYSRRSNPKVVTGAYFVFQQAQTVDDMFA